MPALGFYKQHAGKMSLENAVAWVEASRRAYMVGSGERINFEQMLEIIDEDQGATGPKDWAAALTIHTHIERKLNVQRRSLLKDLQRSANGMKVLKIIREEDFDC